MGMPGVWGCHSLITDYRKKCTPSLKNNKKCQPFSFERGTVTCLRWINIRRCLVTGCDFLQISYLHRIINHSSVVFDCDFLHKSHLVPAYKHRKCGSRRSWWERGTATENHLSSQKLPASKWRLIVLPGQSNSPSSDGLERAKGQWCKLWWEICKDGA